jgi:nucleoside-diphosphate-sugar epimerase
MTVLVTGGCGFVGINLADALLAAGEKVVLFDRISLPDAASEEFRGHGARLAVVNADVRDRAGLDAVFREHSVQRVIHAAVITAGVSREVSEAAKISEVNVGGTINVLSAAKAADCERFVYVSSGQAYGATHDQGRLLQEERSPSRPQDLYGITKHAAEQIALRLGTLWPLDVACVRLGTVFGPWEFDTGVRDMLSPYLRTAQLGVRGEPAVLPSKEYRRDWIYSRDVAEGLIAVLNMGKLPHRVYHLSSGMDWQGAFADWCQLLKKAYHGFSWKIAAGHETPNVSFVVQRDRSPMDVRRIAEDTGFKPKFGPREAHRDYLAWIRTHRQFIDGHEMQNRYHSGQV